VFEFVYDSFVQFENFETLQRSGLKHARYHCANRNPVYGLPGGGISIYKYHVNALDSIEGLSVFLLKCMI